MNKLKSVSSSQITIENKDVRHEGFIILFQQTILNRELTLPEPKLTSDETDLMQETLHADVKTSTIRLREGEHQFALAKAIASFELELYFPDVKDIIRRLYGEKRVEDVQLVRKIQTILKKMEKSGIVKILPKKKPWELQKYAVSSFKFEDIDKNITLLATIEQINQAQTQLNTQKSQLRTETGKASVLKAVGLVVGLGLLIVVCFSLIIWDVLQPAISSIIFVSAFCVAIAGSIMLGRTLGKHDVGNARESR